MRENALPYREAGWMLHVSFGVLSEWNQGFDESMHPFHLPDGRGKAAKVTLEMVRIIVRIAEDLMARGKRLRIKRFTKDLREKKGVALSRKKVQEVLVANGLFAVRTRKKRPRFYQSLRKEIPNGLLSLDGSELIVWLDKEPYPFNVELGVDVKTFAHTAFSVGDTESSMEVIKVLEAHRRDWGDPLGVLFDHGSANLSETTLSYLKSHRIEPVPAGPRNPKGNGTDEGAFSQMKQALGPIELELSSPRALAKAVLEKLICLYIEMRNRMPLKKAPVSPQRAMSIEVPPSKRDMERQHLKEHKMRKADAGEDQSKVDQLHELIGYHRMTPQPDALKRAEKTIKAYEKKAISAAQEAFIRAVNRKAQRKNLAYFFGILKRIQQERDDAAYEKYCRQRYSLEVMRELNRRHEEHQQHRHSVEETIEMLLRAVKTTEQFVKELAIRKARQWTQELMESVRYPGALKSRFQRALEACRELSTDRKKEIWELIEQFINPKTMAESVTRIS